MAGSIARGTPTINYMLLKPMLRKSYHKTGTSADTVRESAVKLNTEEGGMKRLQVGEINGGNCSWVPHERTGIYYPKGQEKVMENVPVGAGKDHIQVNRFSEN